MTFLGKNISLNCFQIRVLCTIWGYDSFVILTTMTELSTILSSCLRKMSGCLPLLHKAMKKWGLVWFSHVNVACYNINVNGWCFQMKRLVRSSRVIKIIDNCYRGFCRNYWSILLLCSKRQFIDVIVYDQMLWTSIL